MDESYKNMKDITASEESIGIMTPTSLLKSNFKLQNSNKKLCPIIKISHLGTQKKVVTFSDMDSVKIYESPFPIPFKIITKNLIAKYTNECEKNKIKPIAKLVKQLEEFSEIDTRIDKLDLKGVKLDYKTVELLEIIFMNIQVHELDVESTLMDEETCVILCEIIEYYNSAVHLSFSSNTRIGFRGWKALCNLISKSSVLDQIDLNRMVVTDNIISHFCRAINSASLLRVLCLENCYLNGNRLKMLATIFSRSDTLEQLYLGENKIASVDCEYIGEMFRKNRNIRFLDLRNNPIQDLGLKMIFDGLYDSEISQLEYLQLWNTNITTVGMQYIATYLCRNKNNMLISTLKSLNIGKNKIGYEGILTLKSSLIRNSSLRRLGLANSKLNDSSLITIGEILAENRSLRKIDVRENDIRENGIIGLSKTITFNKTVVIIKFSNDFKKDTTLTQDFNAAIDIIEKTLFTNRQNELSCDKTNDMISLMSGISTEFVHRNQSQTEPSALKSTLNNIFNFPFELAKRTFWKTASKAETNDAISSSIRTTFNDSIKISTALPQIAASQNVKEHSEEDKKSIDEELPCPTKPCLVKRKPSLTISQSTSRFQVRRCENRKIEHRASKSESIKYERTRPDNINKQMNNSYNIASLANTGRNSLVEEKSQFSLASFETNKKDDLIVSTKENENRTTPLDAVFFTN